MRRLRILRILLPALLVLLGLTIYYNWVPRSAVHSTRATTPDREHATGGGIEIVEYEGEIRSVSGEVDRFEQGEGDALVLEGIRNLELHREKRSPLIISAGRGERQGGKGEQVWDFEDQVTFRERDEGLSLTLPILQVDEQAGEATSSGEITFAAPGFNGRASGLLYGLRGQPGRMDDPVIHDEAGGSLTAREARMHDGVRDIELIGEVRILREGERIDAGRVRMWRDESDRLRRIVAAEGVWGSWAIGGTSAANLRSEDLEANWDAAGEPETLTLTGDALVRHDKESLAASSIDVRRSEVAATMWSVAAREDVLVQGMFGVAPGLLQTDELDAVLDESLAPYSAEARGGVTFEAQETRAEASRGTFRADLRGGSISLHGEGGRKARLSHERTRIAADRIDTDTRGSDLLAEGRVEATLLPSAGVGPGDRPMQIFVAGDAVHFVADRMESSSAGAKLTFTGSVRGWQGERNLAASTIVVDQRDNSLDAVEDVSTRFPREEGTVSVSESHYLQIGADRLAYAEATALAVYTGEVRVRFAEGWLEADRVEVDLSGGGRQIREVRALGNVRMEFMRTATDELPRPVIGEADRVVYDPIEQVVRLYGDETPASIRREGDGGGTTAGRVLAYRLDSGKLDVDAGDHGPAKIRTAGS